MLTGNTIAEIVTAATAATAAIAVGGDATEITGGAVGAATGDYTARRWRPESVLTGNTIAEIVTAATAAIAAIAVGGDATEITGGAVGAATGDYTARRWRPESVLTGNTIAEIVTAATAAIAAIAVGGDATEITGGAVGAATGDYTARRWRPESVLTGNTIAEIVTAATAAIAAIAVGGDATEINEITGGAVGAATTDINAKPTWQPEPGSLSLAA